MSSGINDTTNSADNLKTGASQAFEQAKEKVSEAGGKAAETAKGQLSDRKDQVADGIDTVASALRRTGDQLRSEDTGFVGDYVNKAADAVSNISQHLRENDLDQLMRETEDFARREPTIFLGSAFALGVIAARFLKSSSDRRYSENQSSLSRASVYPSSQVGAMYSRDYGRDRDDERELRDYGYDDSETTRAENRGW
jgi:uncharacterized phage infection (PIP) family protein YhgE